MKKLENQTKKLKAQWKKDKNNYFKIIYRDVLKHKSIKEIHKDLFDMTINPNKMLLGMMIKLSNKAKKLDKGAGNYYDGGLDVLAIGLLKLFNNDGANKVINYGVREYQNSQKENIINNMIEKGRKNSKIFYVASSHKDSAKDHKDYQGKIYVDKNWAKYDVDGKLKEFINKHNIMTIQWVVGSPVWFVSRPNCRHYFVNYSINEILSGNYVVPKRDVGSRDKDIQTQRGVNLEYYEDRLKYLIELYKVHPTDELLAKIEKTKLLIRKWRKTV